MKKAEKAINEQDSGKQKMTIFEDFSWQENKKSTKFHKLDVRE